MMSAVRIQIVRLAPDRDRDIPLPRRMTPHSSGLDICAALERPVTLAPGDIYPVPTGFAIAIPEGYEAQIRPRSGLAVRHGIGVVNSPGTVDADYRGEVRVPVINLGRLPFTICRGDRIAQMVVQRCHEVELDLVLQLDETQRSTGGFGHTGR